MVAKDSIVIPVILFTAIMGFFVMNWMSHTITTKASASGINSSQRAITAMTQMTSATDKADYIFGAVFFGLIFSIMISSFFINASEIFIFFYFLITAVGVFISAVFSNAFTVFVQTSVFGSTINNFPIANHIMMHLPYYVAVTGIIGMIILYAKPAGGSF